MGKFGIILIIVVVASAAFAFCRSSLPLLQNEALAASYGYVRIDRGSSIAFDSLDNPHICYNDSTNESLKYAYYNGTSWQIEPVDNHILPSAPSIAVDSSDCPHICYSDFKIEALKYAYKSGSHWQVDTVADGIITQKSLVIDTLNNPHISFVEITTQKGLFRKFKETLKYAHFSSSGWFVETLDREPVVIGATSIDLDSTNKPHIAYTLADRECAFMYAYYDGSSWHIDAIGAGDGISWPITILLDSNDIPHICHCSFSTTIECISLNDSRWQADSVNSCWTVIYSAMSYDLSGFLNIAYFDRKSSNLHIARYDGNIWKNETVGNIGWDVDDTSISLDSKGTPHLGYFDKKNKSFNYAQYNGEKWYVKEVDSLEHASFFSRLKHYLYP